MASIYTGLTGLQANQTAIDVIANNVANLNTTAFKAGRVTFMDTLINTVSEASGGKTNPQQIGMGSEVASIDVMMLQGTQKLTSRPLDMAILGDGFFLVNNGSRNYYTRDGAFQLNADNKLVMANNGMNVMGWMADPATGLVDTTKTPSDQLSIPNGITYAVPTSKCVIGGNLDSATAVATPQQLTFDIYDSLGSKHRINLSFSKTADNAWDWTATSPDSTVGATSIGKVTFNASGQVISSTGSIDLPLLASNGASSMKASLDLSAMTQLSGQSNVILSNQDGMPQGGMTGFSADADGKIYGMFENGASRLIGQIAVARFTNASGLSREGSNLWRTTPNSGTPTLLPANLAGSKIRSRYLEMSNVDLATEFANMIVSQRSFQANSKSITTSDELMQELMQLKR